MMSVIGALGYSARESRHDLSGPVSVLESRFKKARCQTHKKQTGWSDWPRLTQISHCLFAKFLWIKSVLCLTEMPVVETPVLKEHKLGT